MVSLLTTEAPLLDPANERIDRWLDTWASGEAWGAGDADTQERTDAEEGERQASLSHRWRFSIIRTLMCDGY